MEAHLQRLPSLLRYRFYCCELPEHDQKTGSWLYLFWDSGKHRAHSQWPHSHGLTEPIYEPIHNSAHFPLFPSELFNCNQRLTRTEPYRPIGRNYKVQDTLTRSRVEIPHPTSFLQTCVEGVSHERWKITINFWFGSKRDFSPQPKG